jgi:hypothetical protein
MEDREYETFEELHDDLVLRALFVEELPIEFEDDEFEFRDSFIWFVAKRGDDSWWAFAISDDLTEPHEMIAGMDYKELRKLSIYLGEVWENIETDCPHCVARRHSEAKQSMTLQIYKDMMEQTDERLTELRDLGRFQAASSFIESVSGLKLSLN